MLGTDFLLTTQHSVTKCDEVNSMGSWRLHWSSNKCLSGMCPETNRDMPRGKQHSRMPSQLFWARAPSTSHERYPVTAEVADSNRCNCNSWQKTRNTIFKASRSAWRAVTPCCRAASEALAACTSDSVASCCACCLPTCLCSSSNSSSAASSSNRVSCDHNTSSSRSA